MSNNSDTQLTEKIEISPANNRQKTISEIRAKLRLGQQKMADWQGGPLAVSAVPGAGKSTGMAATAALIIERHKLNPNKQLIVVTFTRAATTNIKQKIRQHLKDLEIPQNSFLVNTLHGLALNIANRHPELSGLNVQTNSLISPTQTNRIIRDCVEEWIKANPRHYQTLIEGKQLDKEETERLRRQSFLRTDALPKLATTVIHEAKSSGFLPEDLRKLSQQTNDKYQILTIAAGLYENYQNLLKKHEFIDYDDMILAALRVLENRSIRQLWQNQVFAVFEDEAQDSSPLQTRLLEILATEPSSNSQNPPLQNLVRVGDPNQAINSTFTPADPKYFRDFCQQLATENRLVTMDQAGRSTQIIIDAANFVLEWVNKLRLAGTEKPFQVQKITPVPLGDPQENPEPEKLGLEIHTPTDTYETVHLISNRVLELFTADPTKNAAILVRNNNQSQWLAKQIKKSYPSINLYEVNQEERRSHVPQEILSILQFVQRPHSPDNLKTALRVLVERKLIPAQDLDRLAILPEQFLYPTPLDTPQKEPVLTARRFCCKLLKARIELPLYQLISFVAISLNYNQSELATAEKLAEKVAIQNAGNSSFSSLINVLNDIVSYENFEPVETENIGESAYTRQGQLTIITMHKAKGLDWDYVFLPFLHEDILPGTLKAWPEVQFLGDFTLSEVARAQIRAGLHKQPIPNINQAWKQAGYLKTAEEFRLLYVAMTRGKRLLWISAEQKAPFFTWTKPDSLQSQNPCPVVPVLKKRFPQSVITSGNNNVVRF